MIYLGAVRLALNARHADDTSTGLLAVDSSTAIQLLLISADDS
jgi:hypothetical protein